MAKKKWYADIGGTGPSFGIGTKDSPFTSLSQLSSVLRKPQTESEAVLMFSQSPVPADGGALLNNPEGAGVINIDSYGNGRLAHFNLSSQTELINIINRPPSGSLVVNVLKSTISHSVDAASFVGVNEDVDITINFINCTIVAPNPLNSIQPVTGAGGAASVVVNYDGCNISGDGDNIDICPLVSAPDNSDNCKVFIKNSLIKGVSNFSTNGFCSITVTNSECSEALAVDGVTIPTSTNTIDSDTVDGIDFVSMAASDNVRDWYYGKRVFSANVSADAPGEGLFGNRRLTPGAFMFFGETYYVDLGRGSLGIGSEASPMHYSQMGQILESSDENLRYAARFLIKGSLPIQESQFIPPTAILEHTSFEAWSLGVHGLWKISVGNLPGGAFSLLNDSHIDHATCSGFAIINYNSDKAIDISLILGGSGSAAAFDNFIIHDNGNSGSVSVQSDAISSECQGATITCHTLNVDKVAESTFVNSILNIEAVSGASATISNCELTVPSGSLAGSDNEWSSDIGSRIRRLLDGDMLEEVFHYNTVKPAQAPGGSGESLSVGIDGVERRGIGGLAFNSYDTSALPEIGSVYKPTKPAVYYRTFWSHLSSFWQLKTAELSDWAESFWTALCEVNHKLLLHARRFLNLQAPEAAETDVFDYQYPVLLGPLNSLPVSMNIFGPKSRNQIISPTTIITPPPEYDELSGEHVYEHVILISKSEYRAVYDVFDHNSRNPMYVVVSVKGESDKVFYQVESLVSSEDGTINRQSLFGHTYGVKVCQNLSGLIGKTFSFYFTTGRAYRIDSDIASIPKLVRFADLRLGVQEAEYVEGVDYKVRDGYLEFFKAPTDCGYVYCDYVQRADSYIYELYGNMVGIHGGLFHGHDGVSGKMSITSAMNGLWQSSQINKYNLAINALYGTPIACDDGEVVGLFESYGYTIASIEAHFDETSTIQLSTPSALSSFFQVGSQVYCDNTDTIYRITEILDRNSGTILVSTPSNKPRLRLGHALYVRLINRFDIIASTKTGTGALKSVLVKSSEGAAAIRSQIGVIEDLGAVPYAYIGGSAIRMSGVGYHFTPGVLEVFFDEDNAVSKTNLQESVLHISWITHKFLLVKHNSEKLIKYYIDSTMDTILDHGDDVEKYDVLTRNVNTIKGGEFPGWSAYDPFELHNNHDERSGVLNIISENSGATPGEYMPNRIDESEDLSYFTSEDVLKSYTDSLMFHQGSRSITAFSTGKSYGSIYEKAPATDKDAFWTSFARGEKNFLQIRGGKIKKPTTDKVDVLVAEFEAFADHASKTIIFKKTSNILEGLFGPEFNNGRYKYAFDESACTLKVYVSPTYYLGGAGVRNATSKFKFGGHYNVSV